MAIAGRVAIVPKGDWSADATYKRLDAVTYNNTLYFAKKDVPAGTVTSNTEYWSKSIVGGAGGVATADEAGVVKPADGLTVAEDGTLKVSIDGTTLTMDQVNNVIKLADTLKEKINGAFPAANVANNQVTTEAGFALDARQANPNIDGSLAKQISDLNGSLNSTVVFNQDSIQITKISPHAYILHIDKLISLNEAFTEIVLGDIPFPCADTSTNIVTQNGDAVMLSVINSKLKINTLIPSYKDETYIRCVIVISD